MQARLSRAGMRVIEARIAHLAYAPEIANAMLRRQQASAIIAAMASNLLVTLCAEQPMQPVVNTGSLY